MTTAFIQIPDPNLRQFKGHGPNFIHLLPSDIAGLEVHVDWMIVVYLYKPQNAGVKDYLLLIEARGKEAGLQITRNQDFRPKDHGIKQFIYSFEKRVNS